MSTAPANSIPPGVTVFCDSTLAPALRAFDPIARAQLGAPVAVLSAVAEGMLAQIQRHTRNDVLFTLSAAMDLAVQAGFVVPSTRINGFAMRWCWPAWLDAFPRRPIRQRWRSWWRGARSR